MVPELIRHNVVKIRLTEATRRLSNQKLVCASCGRQVRRNSNYIWGHEEGRNVVFHRRCFLAEMRACCALA
jgi:hypothetical protein